MDKCRKPQEWKQLSLDDLLLHGDNGLPLSSQRLGELIDQLSEVRARVRKHEEKQARKAEEERRKKEDHIREVTSMDLPLDWENAFINDSRAQGIHADSASDALIYSLNNLGKVDIEYMAIITGMDCGIIIESLQGVIFQNPDTWNECFYQGWETSEEYLSGNLRRKWKKAKDENEKYNGYFKKNLEALEKAMPRSVQAEDIYVTLGSPWIPADIIDDFIVHLFGEPPSRYSREREIITPADYRTLHDELTGSWEIQDKWRYYHSAAVSETYGTGKLEALTILERTLNMKSVAVTREEKGKRVSDSSETLMAMDRQKKLITAFQDWVWKDEERKRRLEHIYDSRYACRRRRVFNGSFLEFPGMSPSVSLYPYQKNAVARIIFSANTLLAHDVGAGKTYVMIAAGQELRRVSLSTKNMYVVPNNLTAQWKEIFLQMYPAAKLLCVTPVQFKPANRRKILEEIRDGNYDGIIIAYSCFEQIPLSKRQYVQNLQKKLDAVICEFNAPGKGTASLEKIRDKMRDTIDELKKTVWEPEESICFDQMGITRLFVDEAHNFKNVPIDTKINGTLGISVKGSKRCQDMLNKVYTVQSQNDGKGVVMATGTPISNSLTDIYVMQQYLQSGELALLNLQSFDSWIGMFAEKTEHFEIDVDTGKYRMATRFSEFHNLPELTSILSAIADFHPAATNNVIPDMDGYMDVLVPRTEEFAEYLKEISIRADMVRRGNVPQTEDNMLKITGDGRKAALDLRLVSPNAGTTDLCKAARCAENVAAIWEKTQNERSTQLIFCDTSTPKAGFNLYDELRTRLTELGIPEDEIAYIHDAPTERKKTELFARINTGKTRVLLGSTFKLGLGVNVQERLIALHHLDVPWRPSDMIQREGRILRQGNSNSKVYIYRYITEGSFDAYSWQLLETKQKLISDILSGCQDERSGPEVDDAVLNYAEVKALAIGNPLIRERVETANRLSRLSALRAKEFELRASMENKLIRIPDQKAALTRKIRDCRKDLITRDQWKAEHPQPEDTVGKQQRMKERTELRAVIAEEFQKTAGPEKDRFLAEYQGFRIWVPAGMNPGKPSLLLTGAGRYPVDMGDAEIGYLIRIDHSISNMNNYLERMEEQMRELEKKECDLRKALARKDDYGNEIEKLRSKLDWIDRTLGVKDNEKP